MVKKTDSKTEKPKVEQENPLWTAIRGQKIEIFALPRQKVEDHCTLAEALSKVDPTKLYLVPKSSAVLPALEAALGENFEVDKVDKWLTVARKK